MIVEYIQNTLGYISGSSYNAEQIVYAVAGTFFLVITVVIIDLLYRIFRHFWR